MTNELRKFNVQVEPGGPGAELVFNADKAVFPGDVVIDTYDDHRMAMSFAGLVLKTGKLNIDQPEVVNKSYPGFWADLQSVAVKTRITG
jgi:5-enolpyruvylshikimate-3-phosphate synthase